MIEERIVEAQLEIIFARRAAQQQYAQARLEREIEGLPGFGPQTIVQGDIRVNISINSEIGLGKVDLSFRCDHLEQLPAALLQSGSQDLVAFCDFVEGGAQNIDVEVAGEAEYERNVIEGIRRIQLLERKKTALPEGGGESPDNVGVQPCQKFCLVFPQLRQQFRG